MKKLMIAAAIVCAAACVQAASVSWTSNSKSLTTTDGTVIRDPSSADFAKIVLVNLGATADFEKATASQIIARGSTSGTTTMTLNSTTGTKGGRVEGLATFGYSTGLIKENDYLALMAYDGTTLSQLIYTSGDDKDKLVNATYKVTGLANDSSKVTGAAIGFTGNFAVQDVPEPTSAMLLVLGLAGLALRRKQA